MNAHFMPILRIPAELARISIFWDRTGQVDIVTANTRREAVLYYRRQYGNPMARSFGSVIADLLEAATERRFTFVVGRRGVFMGGISLSMIVTPRNDRNVRINTTFGVFIADLAPGEAVILRYSINERQRNIFRDYYEANVIRLEEDIDINEALDVAAALPVPGHCKFVCYYIFYLWKRK